MSSSKKAEERLFVERAIVVEGRDDVAAVERAVDALLIPTHGFGISRETWGVIDKAAAEKGLIILTDPDHAGEQIRKRIGEKHPGSLHAYVSRIDATDADDIGIENASPEVIRDAVERALELAGNDRDGGACEAGEKRYAEMSDLRELGLSGADGASARREAVCRSLGIGYGNAGAMIKKLRGFGIGIDELKEEVKKIREENSGETVLSEA